MRMKTLLLALIAVLPLSSLNADLIRFTPTTENPTGGWPTELSTLVPPEVSVMGQVVRRNLDGSGVVLPDVLVVLKDTASNRIYHAYTTQDGGFRFSIPYISVTTYKVIVYGPVELSPNTLTVDSTEINFFASPTYIFPTCFIFSEK